jgi:hypothetical protein
MNYLIFNLPQGSRTQAACLLQAKMWPLERDERHCGTLAAGDLALVHIGTPYCQFIGRVELVSAYQDWKPSASQACPDGHSSGVLLNHIEEWPRAVPLTDAVKRIDPTHSNPTVQSNAAGFRSRIVLITAEEFAAVVALSREAPLLSRRT